MIDVTGKKAEWIEIKLQSGSFWLEVDQPSFKELQKELLATGEERCELLLSLISGWKDVAFEGELKGYSRENLHKLFSAYPVAYRETIFALQDHLNRHRLTEAEAKN